MTYFMNITFQQTILFSTKVVTMFTKDSPGGKLRRKIKMRAQLKIQRCDVITLRN